MGDIADMHLDSMFSDIEDDWGYDQWLLRFERSPEEAAEAAKEDFKFDPVPNQFVAEWTCRACGSHRWVGHRYGVAHEGWTRNAQCVPCGHVQELPAGAGQ